MPGDPSAAAAAFADALARKAPLERTWPQGAPLSRCHHNSTGPAEFGAGRPARFSPFDSLLPASPPGPVPVLYAADGDIGALSETIFRDLPLAGRKTLARSLISARSLSGIAVDRPLRFADFTGHGLARLDLRRRDVIESDRRAYPITALLAQAVHAHPARYDGIAWISRQHDLSIAFVLFADRVPTDALAPVGTRYPLAFGAGREMVDRIADDLGITIVEP